MKTRRRPALFSSALDACVRRKNTQPPVGLVKDSTLALHGLNPKFEAQVHAPSIRLNINNLLSECQHPTQLWEQWLKNLNKRIPLLREALCLVVLSDKGLSDYELSCILFAVPGGGLLDAKNSEAETEPDLKKDKPNNRDMSPATANVRLQGRNKMPPPLRRGSKFHAGGDVISMHVQASTDSGADCAGPRLSSTEHSRVDRDEEKPIPLRIGKADWDTMLIGFQELTLKVLGLNFVRDRLVAVNVQTLYLKSNSIRQCFRDAAIKWYFRPEHEQCRQRPKKR